MTTTESVQSNDSTVDSQKLTGQTRVSEQILNSTSAQLGHAVVPFTLIHAGKYRRQIKK